MKTLRFGNSGPQVELLQLALSRSGHYRGSFSGSFDDMTRAALCLFQCQNNLIADGIAGKQTHRALTPYYTGYLAHTAVSGDTVMKLAKDYSTTVQAIKTANPDLYRDDIKAGSVVIVPFGFPVIPTNISLSSIALSYYIRGLSARYPFIRVSQAGNSVMNKPINILSAGKGKRRVFFNGAHHANEWITSLIVLKFLENLSEAYAADGKIRGYPADDIFDNIKVYIAPCVNPDGVDLVTGELRSGTYYDSARSMALCYPRIAFPSGWKANIKGVDLNLQYPAGWTQARKNKYRAGFVCPGPRDYVGSYALSAPESKAVYDFTRSIEPDLILAFHSQGKVIYWKYLDYEPPGSYELALTFGGLSGYDVEITPYTSGFAGYKDWFIQDYNRPGYTIEVGYGESPLPLSDFDDIYRDVLGILVEACR